MTDDVRPDPDQPEPKRSESDRPELEGPAADSILAEEATKAAASDTFEQAIDGLVETDRKRGVRKKGSDDEIEVAAEDQAGGKLERLQKILAQAGIASRRHAEELITEGRVQVNGQVVTELGTKADAGRDHIRVDGKLLQGSERLRYFMLNKPKGFVTTVSDPEGRPTIMQFFTKMRERLYPVGRLDYLSEGLLLVTNDGELANKLTRAASGVEKTYLVKVSGQPSEEDIDRLREGVAIERGKPGSGRVQSAPAEIHKIRQGDNPWYEVVLIEGRNRELRKMFEEIGHRVEKIRRVGYGPLVLDLEPGKLRELDPEELENLHKAAEGKYRKPKARTERKRGPARESFRPSQKPRWSQPRAEARGGADRKRGPARESSRPAEKPRWSQPRSEAARGDDRKRGPARESFRPEQKPRWSQPRAEAGRGDERKHGPAREFRPEKKPRWDRPRSEAGQTGKQEGREAGGQAPRFERRPAQRPEPGRSRSFERRPERSNFRVEDGGKARPDTRPRFRDDRAKRPPRPAGQGPGYGKNKRFGGERSGGTGRGPKPFGARPVRREFRPTQEPGAEQQQRPRFEGKSQERSAEPRPFRQDRQDRSAQPRFERPRRAEGTTSRGEGRSARPERRDSGPRPGGFKPGRRGASGFKPGSTRSGGGRPPASKPGRKPGGNRGGRRPA